VETATALLKTIGVVATATTAIGGSLFKFLKWKNGRKVKSVQQDNDASGEIIVEIEGDGNTVHVTRNVFQLAENKKVLEAIEGALTPIETREADRIEFRDGDKAVAAYSRDEVKAIIKSCDSGPDDIAINAAKPKPEIIIGTLHAYGPVFAAKAPNWRFLYKRKPIYADITETTIAKDTVRRGGSFLNDRYRVRMEVTPAATEDGTPHYKILDVLDFTPAEQQISLPLKKRKAPKKRK
jgi:hypothetical protein